MTSKDLKKGCCIYMAKKAAFMGLLFSFLIIFTVSNVEAAKVKKIEIIDYGIYETKVNPDTKVSGIKIIQREKLIKKTDRIPAKVGTVFGFNFRVVGEPAGESVKVIHRFYPPQASKGLVEEISQEGPMGSKLFRAYRFDTKEEAVPGKWKFEIWHEGKKMAEKTFIVGKPK